MLSASSTEPCADPISRFLLWMSPRTRRKTTDGFWISALPTSSRASRNEGQEMIDQVRRFGEQIISPIETRRS